MTKPTSASPFNMNCMAIAVSIRPMRRVRIRMPDFQSHHVFFLVPKGREFEFEFEFETETESLEQPVY